MTLEQILKIIERYKLRIPPSVYYELLADVRNEQESTSYQWCTDCKEYDQEKHCCHRWSKVIRDTVEEMKQEPKTSYLSIDDVMSVFDDFMCDEVDEDGTETFLEMLKDKAESEVDNG